MDPIWWLKSLFFSFQTLLILLPFLGFTSAAVTTPASCHPNQWSALLKLKEGFIESNLTSWQPGTSCCHGWEGVSCDETTGHVTTLDLNSYNIEGNLSVANFDLTSLQHLNLAFNNFSQNQIPDGFEKLTQLTYLNLSFSYFTGQIPIGIGNLTKLTSLDLSYNWYLKLHKPNLRMLIRNLTNLRTLHLGEVNVSENGTEWCGALSESLPFLQVLNMHSCNLSGPFDPSLSRLHSLAEIDLSGNNIQSSVPNYFCNFQLKHLQLSSSNLTGSFPPKIFHIPTLTALIISDNTDLLVILPDFLLGSPLEIMDLGGTNLYGHIPYSIGNLINLSYLDLSYLYFSVGSNLLGEIPSSILKLGKLVYLDLSFNSLSGSIPQSLFSHPNLETLYLRYNKLSGEFKLEEESPVWSSSLTRLYLDGNRLTGSIPQAIYKLSNLEALYLSGNHLSGPIPSSIFGLPSLQQLNLAQNHFNGTIKLNLLQHLPNLTTLVLSDNQLFVDVSDEQLPSLFPRIKSVGLASCNLTRIPHLLKYSNGLRYVDLSKNHLCGVIPSWIWEKFSLTDHFVSSFNLSYNEFTSVENISICLVLPVCRTFGAIDFSFNKLSGHIPLIGARFLDYSNNEFLDILSNYTLYLNTTIYLSLSANKLTGEIPTSICKLLNLQALDLSHNNLSGLIPSNIFEAPRLQLLILTANNLQGIVHSHIEKPCQLLLLDLSNNNLDGVVPRSLKRCTNLMSLNIENNRFSDTFPFWLGKIPNLQVLIIKSNQFHGTLELPKSASNNLLFQKLRVIDLASNNFHGSLPPLLFRLLSCMVNLSLYEMAAKEFVDRINSAYVYCDYGIAIIEKGIPMTLQTLLASLMVEIDLSNNNFSGDIPEVIGTLSALKALNLSHNSFVGSISHSIKGLDHIESLDLSWNNLSGEIPQELSLLDSLCKLNLSFNHLVGRIPQSPHFSTFDNSSYEGNSELCGVPLSKQCAGPSPTKNLTFPSVSIAKNMREIVFLCLFVGLGFGTGFAIAILYPVIKRAKTRSTTCRGRRR